MWIMILQYELHIILIIVEGQGEEMCNIKTQRV